MEHADIYRQQLSSYELSQLIRQEQIKHGNLRTPPPKPEPANAMRAAFGRAGVKPVLSFQAD